MNVYVYRWSIKPEARLTLDLRMTAPSFLVAQRVVHRFLKDHDGDSWSIEYVSREDPQALQHPMAISQPDAAR